MIESFDAIVIGAGMFGGYFAEKLYRLGAGNALRILVLDAGAFLFPTHIQNLPQQLGGKIFGTASLVVRMPRARLLACLRRSRQVSSIASGILSFPADFRLPP